MRVGVLKGILVAEVTGGDDVVGEDVLGGLMTGGALRLASRA